MPSTARRGRADALLHLARGLVGEGDGEDLVRPGGAGLEEVRDAGGERRVLPVPAPASTRTGPSSASTASRCAGLRSSSQGASRLESGESGRSADESGTGWR